MTYFEWLSVETKNAEDTDSLDYFLVKRVPVSKYDAMPESEILKSFEWSFKKKIEAKRLSLRKSIQNIQKQIDSVSNLTHPILKENNIKSKYTRWYIEFQKILLEERVAMYNIYSKRSAYEEYIEVINQQILKRNKLAETSKNILENLNTNPDKTKTESSTQRLPVWYSNVALFHVIAAINISGNDPLTQQYLESIQS